MTDRPPVLQECATSPWLSPSATGPERPVFDMINNRKEFPHLTRWFGFFVPLQVLLEVARSLGVKCHTRGTMLSIEGPRFSSRAESLMFRQWGADVINMTTVPEVVLAKEAGLCYASIAMATDYDCWKEHEEAVSGKQEAVFSDAPLSLLVIFL